MKQIDEREQSGGGVYAKVTSYIRKQSPIKVIGVAIALVVVIHLL